MTEQDSRDMVYEDRPIEGIPSEILDKMLSREGIESRLRHRLAGETYQFVKDKTTGRPIGRWVVTNAPLVNEKGINVICSFIGGALEIDKIVTRITEDETRIRAMEFRKGMIYLIYGNMPSWGIDPTHASAILNDLDDKYFFALTASRRGTMLDTVKPIYKREERYTPVKQPSRTRSIFGFLNRKTDD